jgi:hypothetical protein
MTNTVRVMGHITAWEEDYKGNNTSPSLQSPLANSWSPSCTNTSPPLALQSMFEPCPHLQWGFSITHNYTHARTPLDEWSARRRGLYLHRTTQHINTDKSLCSQRDSNPGSQQRSGSTSTPRTRGHTNTSVYSKVQVEWNKSTGVEKSLAN